MKQFYQAIMLLLISGLSSCDCYVSVKGRVVSSSTGKPIDGVVIRMLNRNFQTVSNLKGQFLLDEQTGFCYDPKLELTKDGYKPFRLRLSSGSKGESYEVNTESKFIDYHEPIESRMGVWIDLYSQNFERKGDSIIFYLDQDDLDQELEKIKEELKSNSG